VAKGQGIYSGRGEAGRAVAPTPPGQANLEDRRTL
jgi:hypothetical protein